MSKISTPKNPAALFEFVMQRKGKFANCDFSGAGLSGASFVGADLRGASFRGAQLDGSDFNSAKLDGADFSEASLIGTSLVFASGIGADFSQAEATRADFSHADFSKTFFNNTELERAVFVGTTLDGAQFNEALLTASVFVCASLVGTEMDASLNGTVFADVDLSTTFGLERAHIPGDVYLDLRSAKLVDGYPWSSRLLEAARSAQPTVEAFNQATPDGPMPWDLAFKRIEHSPSPAVLEQYRTVLDRAQAEEEMQQFLTEHPELFTTLLPAHHGAWVLPKVKLGTEYVTDFLVAGRSSVGLQWVAVELESPHSVPFKADGGQAAALTHALGQINEWRSWFEANRHYAAGYPPNGMGLVNIRPSLPGLVLIGRRESMDAVKASEIRNQIQTQQRIEVRSFDAISDPSPLVKR